MLIEDLRIISGAKGDQKGIGSAEIMLGVNRDGFIELWKELISSLP
jgi:hypothetical protein